ncbi:hypothetical protein [Brevibacillus dissolubilis]|uniref:hypothetical protein n=1 Tax=Brevibacillus dissolubilis TaxID=1844116 RepID=UPI0011173A68|nr:hypothetical protein [Brevibacillus dissolubilis]
MSKKYLVSSYLEINEEDGEFYVVQTNLGRVLEVNDEVITCLQFFNEARDFDQLKAFLLETGLEKEETVDEQAKEAMDLLVTHELILPIE